MRDRIGIEFTHRVAPIVPLSLVEAETESYPYAVYNIDTTPVWTKDGVDHLNASVSLDIVSDDFDQANDISEAVAQTMEPDNQEGAISAKLLDTSVNCYEGIWIITQNYRIKQLK